MKPKKIYVKHFNPITCKEFYAIAFQLSKDMIPKKVGDCIILEESVLNITKTEDGMYEFSNSLWHSSYTNILNNWVILWEFSNYALYFENAVPDVFQEITKDEYMNYKKEIHKLDVENRMNINKEDE